MAVVLWFMIIGLVLGGYRDGLYYFPVINGIKEAAKLYIHSLHDIRWIEKTEPD